ncbi:MAG TPA: hypothetical protein VGG15_00770, partial [Terriglobales bacterium]
MTSLPEPSPPEQGKEHGPLWAFFGDDGLRPGWSVLLFVALVYIFKEMFLVAVSFVSPGALSVSPMSPVSTLVFECVSVILVLAATWIMARIEGRRVAVYGYQ